jgi:hypothetical protein
MARKKSCSTRWFVWLQRRLKLLKLSPQIMWERKAQSSLYGGGKKREIYKDSGIYTFVDKRLLYQRLCLFLLLFSHCGQKATRSKSNAVFGWPSNLTGHGALVSLSATSSATGALFPVVWEKRNNRSAFSTITVWEKFWLGFSKNWSPYTGGEDRHCARKRRFWF